MSNSTNFESRSSEDQNNVSKSDFLRSDTALKEFLSKEVKNSSAVFKDYAPTSALVRAAMLDAMETLGISY